MDFTRRSFLVRGGAFAVGFAGLQRWVGPDGAAAARTIAPLASGAGYGPLLPDPARLFDLPAGFSYKVIARAGDPMADGLVTPGLPDGMAAFPGPGGLTLLVCNHELTSDADMAPLGPFGAQLQHLAKLDPSRIYDRGHGRRPALGGTTTLVFDTKTQTLRSRHLSLAGTIRNCAGGPTPWGTWITCEESVIAPGSHPDEGDATDLERSHGWCFEVPAAAEPSLAEPRPILGMGRFNHEAVAVHPDSGVVYLTEDRHDGLIYRFIPATPGTLHAGGRLQALALHAAPSFDTRNWDTPGAVKPGAPMPVRWIDLADTAAPKDDLRLRGFAAGAARFARGEGMWYGRDSIFFACTNGGPKRLGQLWRYTPSPSEGAPAEASAPGTLELFVESHDSGVIKNADNITVAPWGDLIVCEDSGKDNGLHGVTPAGEVYRLGRNVGSDSELAGSAFSPDGTTLFVNIQVDGLTLAVTGPWRAA